MKKQQWIRFVIKPVVFAGALVPLALLLVNFFNDNLGANPISEITHETGIWALRCIVATIALTPIRKLTGLHDLIKFRRMIGLFGFFYACLHFVTYIWLDQFFDWQSILHYIPKRPFITVGFAAFVLLIPLALTSTKRSIRRLGGKRWNLLHRLVYLTAIGGVIHYLWLVKVVTQPQITYAVIVGVLLGFRIVAPLFERRARNIPVRETPAVPTVAE